MQKWVKLFIMLCQETAHDRSHRGKSRRVEMIGSAIVKKDNFTGKKFWVSCDGEGDNEVTFSGGQPLMFPPDGLQIGTIVHLLPPEE